MKSFTDLEQSKKLAKILPLESADMHWCLRYFAPKSDIEEYDELPVFGYSKEYRPCWSLATLIDLIQDDIRIEKHLFDQSDMFTYSIISDIFEIRTYEYDELIDACVEMILKLKDMNVL